MADGKIPNLAKSIDDIRAELFARIEEVQDEYQEKGWLPARLNLNKGIVRGILELVCWMIWQLYQVLNTIYRQAVPLEASGEWLDVHAVQVGISRKPELRATGNLMFSRPEGADTDRNIPIPAGTIVRTLPDGKGEVYRYVTTADAVLSAGSDTVTVPAQSETYGAAANAGTGQICEIVTPVDGVGGVTNKADWLTLEGADAENDVSLRKRYRLAWMAQAGNTRAAYEAAALSVHRTRVVRAYAWHHLGGKVTGLPQILAEYGYPDSVVHNCREDNPERWAHFELHLLTPTHQWDQAEIDAVTALANLYKPGRSVLNKITFALRQRVPLAVGAVNIPRITLTHQARQGDSAFPPLPLRAGARQSIFIIFDWEVL